MTDTHTVCMVVDTVSEREEQPMQATITIAARISERGQGFPQHGELVASDNSLYRVCASDGTIHTDDRDGRGNYMYADLEAAGDIWDISEEDYDRLRDVHVEIEA